MATDPQPGWRWKLLDRPVDSASLAAFRILLGTVLCVAMIRFLSKGWVNDFFVTPQYFFMWEWFPWVRPLPAWAMHALFVTLAGLALGIALGIRHRLCAALFCLGFTYVELIDRTNYLNHYYLVSLLTALLVFLPADRCWSLDARWRATPRSGYVPAWSLNLLRFQIGVVYFFAGVAKLNTDWLLEAQPLRLWLNARSDLPVIGDWLTESWTAHTASWCGALFDLTIPFLLLGARSRSVAFALVVTFHLATAVLLPTLGMFPWLMLAAATVFLPPDWPRRLLSRRPLSTREHPAQAPTHIRPRVLTTLLAVYCAVQVLVPLRGWLQPGDSAWTGEGFNFAWRVMVAEKAGLVTFEVVHPTNQERRTILPSRFLTPLQEQMMAQDPALIRQLARHIARQSGDIVHVHADAFATLNGRPHQRLIDPLVDLAAPTTPDGWIAPLQRRPVTSIARAPGDQRLSSESD